MKILVPIAATALALVSISGAAASAQPGYGRGDPHDDHRHDRHGYRDRHYQHCRMEYHHHRRFRVCR